MSVAVITGSSGLIGSEAAIYFGGARPRRRRDRQRHAPGLLRRRGVDGLESTASSRSARREATSTTISTSAIARRSSTIFRRYGGAVELVIHAAAQPSHDWAAREPFTDFDINAVGTLNLLEATRLHAAERGVHLHLHEQGLRRPAELACRCVELETRWEIEPEHTYVERHPRGHVDRPLPAQPLRRLQGRPPTSWCRSTAATSACAPRASAAGRSPGPNHSAAELHGFLAYVMRCAMTGTPVHRLRLQGQAGPRRDPQQRPHPRLRRVLPGAARRRGLQHRRRPLQQRLRDRGDRAGAGDRRATSSTGPTRRPTASATTSGGSATTVASRRTTPAGSSSTTSVASSRRSTRRIVSGGGVLLFAVARGAAEARYRPAASEPVDEVFVLGQGARPGEGRLRVVLGACSRAVEAIAVAFEREDGVTESARVGGRDDEAGAGGLDLRCCFAVR